LVVILEDAIRELKADGALGLVIECRCGVSRTVAWHQLNIERLDRAETVHD
jgi:hypothetical protein